MNLHGRSLLKEIDLTRGRVPLPRRPRRAAAGWRSAWASGRSRLAGRSIALIFEKTSTRTRSAFEVAAHDEGGHVTYLGPDDSQLGRKESVKDTARVLGRMFDGIEYRGCRPGDGGDPGRVRRGAGVERAHRRLAPHPDAGRHPHHARSRGRPLAEVTYCYLGDGRNNTANSLLVTGCLLGMDVRICAPESAAARAPRCRSIARGSPPAPAPG